MDDSFAGVVLAAGAGTRMRPLTQRFPKVLCPVNNEALVDHNLARMRTATGDIVVNVHHFATAIVDHLGSSVQVSHEETAPLGTAGALGKLRDWIDGRPTIVLNGDAWCPGTLDALVAGHRPDRPTVLVAGPAPFGPTVGVCGSIMPWSVVRDLEPTPSGLYEVSWRNAHAAGELDWVNHLGPFTDCGTPGDYLNANLAASGGANVVAPSAIVDGTISESVVWPGATVEASESLHRAIRTPDCTVLIR